MKVKKLAFDVDGVIADFVSHYVEYYNKVFYGKDKISKEDFKEYNFLKSLKFQDCLWTDKGFFENMPLIDGAKEIFPKIYRNYDTIIITDCVHPEERVRWMEKMFPDFDKNKLFFAKDKSKFEYDILIDDYPVNLAAAGDDKSILYSHNYNREYKKAVVRVNNWQDIYKWVIENVTPT